MKDRYERALHAMQSGVAMEMNYEDRATQPKHLRVGINSAMSDQMAIARLLIQKGIFTEKEYLEAVTIAMEEEVKRYEELLSKRLGREVTLA